jgi:hypothetical protein
VEVTPSFPVDATAASYHCAPRTPGAKAASKKQSSRQQSSLSLSEEGKLAATFYCEFMTSFERKGPLSESALSAVAKPSDIPRLLHEVWTAAASHVISSFPDSSLVAGFWIRWISPQYALLAAQT